MNDSENSPPTAQDALDTGGQDLSADQANWMRRARSAYKSSTTYIDNNMRKGWNDSIRAFNSLHPNDSKYNQPSYAKRSSLYRPKTRSVIRKNEAAAAAAFFSSVDVVSVSPINQDDKMSVAGAEINKALLQYRLTKSIPWYQVVLGGLQDAQTVGVVCAHVYWHYKGAKTPPRAVLKAPEAVSEDADEYPNQQTMPKSAFVTMGGDKNAPPVPAKQAEPAEEQKPAIDKPCIDLFPVENLRIDPGSDWTDPINSSPFVIQLIPLYLQNVKERMESGEWFRYGDGALRASTATTYDSTRSARMNNREDPYNSESTTFSGYEICWVQRHIHRKDGVDWEFYTLGDFALLSNPRLLTEVDFTGERPYVLGSCVLEAHKVYPSSVPELGRGLQDEANEIANQRIDNVKFVLNKKFLLKRGKDADIAGLVRNVPGGVVMLDDPEKDVRELSWPDVTASAYEEQSRIDNDMNDLLGNFSAGQVMADHGINAPARNMAMLGQSAGTLVEYLLRTYVETFVQPVLRKLVKLEQQYETDQVVLALVSQKASLFKKFGIDKVTDELLEQELILNVNVGMGATDPQMKLQKFIAAMNQYLDMLGKAPPGVNMEEVGKEIFSHMGYQDGSRFLTQDNPQMLKLQQQIQQMQQMIQQQEMKLQDRSETHQVKRETNAADNATKLQTTQIQEENMNLRTATVHLRAIKELQDDRTHEVQVGNMDRAHDRVMSRISHENHMRESRQMSMKEAR